MTNSSPSSASRGQVRPPVVAVHQHRAGDPQPPLVVGPHPHPVERHPVVDAPAARLAHPVGGHRVDPGRPGPVEDRRARRRPADQHRGEPGQRRRPARRVEQPDQLGGDDRDVRAPRRRRARRRWRPGPGPARCRTAGTGPGPARPATWEAGRHSSQRSPGRAPTRASDAPAEWVSAAALSSTPFGSPVDPEVVMMTAVSAETPGDIERTVASPSASMTALGLEDVDELPDLRGRAGPRPAAGWPARSRRARGARGSTSRPASATPESSTACSGRLPSWPAVAGRVGLAGLSTVVGGKRSHGR